MWLPTHSKAGNKSHGFKKCMKPLSAKQIHVLFAENYPKLVMLNLRLHEPEPRKEKQKILQCHFTRSPHRHSLYGLQIFSISQKGTRLSHPQLVAQRRTFVFSPRTHRSTQFISCNQTLQSRSPADFSGSCP